MSTLDKQYIKELRNNYYRLESELDSIIGIQFGWRNGKFLVECGSLRQVDTLPIVPMFVKFTQNYSYIVEYRPIKLDGIKWHKVGAMLQADTQDFDPNINFQVI